MLPTSPKKSSIFTRLRKSVTLAKLVQPRCKLRWNTSGQCRSSNSCCSVPKDWILHMSTTVEAIYEDGKLVLQRPLPLADKAHVRVTVEFDKEVMSDAE